MSSTGHLPELESLRSQVATLARELAERDQSMRTQHRHLEQTMQDLREQSGLLRAIVEGTAADTGEEFFRSFVRHLAQALNVRYALVGEWHQETPAVVRTLAVWSGTALAEPFEYNLQHTPCADVVGQRLCLYESDVRQLFPEDHLLAQMNVESYCGMPLFDRSGKPLGLLVVMDDRPLTRAPFVKDLLQIFAARAASELQRQQTEELRQRQQRHLADAQALAHLGSWDWDIDSGEVQWSDELYRIFGHEPGAGAVTYDTFFASLYPDDHDRVLAAINDALLGKGPFRVDYRIVRPNGEVRFIHACGDVHRDAAGHPLSMAGTVLDVTERKQGEEALRLSEERWQLAVRGSNDGIWDWNILTGDIFFSSQWKVMRGFEDHDIANHIDEWRSRIHPDDLDRVLQSIDAYLTKATPEFCEEYRVQRKDGSYMWILDRGLALWADDGTPTRMVGSESDITERKQALLRLAQQESLLRSILDAEPECVKRVAADGTLLQMNEAGLCFIESDSFEQVAGRSVYDLVAPEFLDLFRSMHEAVLQGASQQLEFQIVGLKGTRRWMETHAVPLWNPIDHRVEQLAVTRDITERKINEQLLAAEKRVLEMIATDIPLQEVLALMCRTVEELSHGACCSILLLDPDGLHVRHGAAPSLPEAYVRAIDGAAIGPTAGSCGTAAFTRRRVIVSNIADDPLWADYRDLALRHGLLACWSTPVTSSDGSVLGTFAVYYHDPRPPTDVDLRLVERATNVACIAIERARAEEALRFAKFTMDRAADAVYWIDPHAKILEVNEAACAMLGYSKEELCAMTVHDLNPDFQMDRWPGFWAETQRRGTMVFETFHRAQNGRLIPIEVSVNYLSYEGKEYHCAFVRNITERKRTEDEQKRLLTELAESQKHFEQIFHWTPSAVAISTLVEGRFLDVNERLLQLTGYSREELIGHTTAELQLWADPPERARVIQEILQQGALHNKEGLLRTKSGDIRAIMVSVDRIQMKATSCLIYVAHDITERKQAETMRARQYEALQAVFRMTVALSRASSLEELYEQGIDGVQRALKVDRAAILLFDDDGVMRFTASQGLSEQYQKAVEGHSPWSREAVDPPPICVSDIEEAPSMEAYRDIFRAEGIRALGFIPLVSSDGLLGKFMLYYDAPHRLMEEEIQVAQTIAGTIAFMIQRKRAEERLVTSERRLQTVLDTLPIGVWFTDRSGKILLANPAAKQIWSNIKQIGLQTPNNPSGWWETLEPAGEPHRWALSHVLTKGVSSLNESLDLECLDGARKTIRNTAVPVQNEAGVVIGAIVLNEDITLLRQAQEALKLTQFSVDHAVEGFFWIGSDARILTVNNAACRMLEYSREELLAMTVHDIDPHFPPERWSIHWQELKQKGSLTIESKQWSKTGRVVDAEITISYLQYAGREYHCAIMRDITERKRVEETLRQRECDLQAAVEERERISEDLHDGILQLLYAVGLGLEACQSLLLLQPQQPPQQRKKTAKAIGQALDQAVDQLNAVMGEVRNFIAGLQSQVLQGEDFPTVLRTMVQTLTASQPMRCRLMIDQRASRRVSAEQALHLLHVVREALSNSLRHGHATRATVSFRLLTRSIRLLVTDNGRGFHPDHAQGIGHGLANMAARAHRMGGRFTVQSRPKQGTQITIDLPKEEAYARG